MPQPKKARRKLNITSCLEVYRGNGTKGEFVIYEIQATDENGVLIQQKLASFADLPLGLDDYDVAPYIKDGELKNYTVTKPSGGGGGSAKYDALKKDHDLLEARVEHLENVLHEWTPLIAGLRSQLYGGSKPPEKPSDMEPAGHYDDDVPF